MRIAFTENTNTNNDGNKWIERKINTFVLCILNTFVLLFQ